MDFNLLLIYLNSVLIVFILFWIKFYPNNRKVQGDIRELETYLEELDTRTQADIDDLYDLLNNYIAKWSNRETTRQVRAKEKDLKEDNPLSKKGMISPSDLKKYGFTK